MKGKAIMVKKTETEAEATLGKPQEKKKPEPLEITTSDFVRNHVVIDGESYDIRHPDEISLPDRITIARVAKQLLKLADLDKSEAESATREFNKVFNYILLAPDEVKAKLKTGHKLDIVNAVFTQEGWKKESVRNSESSPPFKDSMGEIQ